MVRMTADVHLFLVAICWNNGARLLIILGGYSMLEQRRTSSWMKDGLVIGCDCPGLVKDMHEPVLAA